MGENQYRFPITNIRYKIGRKMSDIVIVHNKDPDNHTKTVCDISHRVLETKDNEMMISRELTKRKMYSKSYKPCDECWDVYEKIAQVDI